MDSSCGTTPKAGHLLWFINKNVCCKPNLFNSKGSICGVSVCEHLLRTSVCAFKHFINLTLTSWCSCVTPTSRNALHLAVCSWMLKCKVCVFYSNAASNPDLAACELHPNVCRWKRHQDNSTGTVTMRANWSVSVCVCTFTGKHRFIVTWTLHKKATLVCVCVC